MKKITVLSLALFLLVGHFTTIVGIDEGEIRRPFIPGREQNIF